MEGQGIEMVGLQGWGDRKVLKKEENSRQRIFLVMSLLNSTITFTTGVMLVIHGLQSDNLGGIFSLFGTGLWCATVFGIFGVMSYWSRRWKTRIFYILTIVFSVLSFLMSGILVTISALSLQTSSYTFTTGQETWWMRNLVLLIIQMVIGVEEMILVSFWWKIGKL